MLYFLCKVRRKWQKCGKNVFDFIEKYRYNVGQSPISGPF